MGTHANFNVIQETPEYIYIKDTGYTTSMSVTNDVEWVIARLDNEYGIEDRWVFYMDSQGNIDEIVHNYGRFTSFKFGHAGVVL
jgi:hypothetical protein